MLHTGKVELCAKLQNSDDLKKHGIAVNTGLLTKNDKLSPAYLMLRKHLLPYPYAYQ